MTICSMRVSTTWRLRYDVNVISTPGFLYPLAESKVHLKHYFSFGLNKISIYLLPIDEGYQKKV